MVSQAPPVQVLLRIDRALLAKVDARAERYGLTRSAWLRMALERAVDLPTQVTTEQRRF